MGIQAGTQLGSYEIMSLLSKGGMGEVYRARDTRLERIVAIKVLSEQLSSKPEAKARFEREAKVIAALNHPHICTLYDVGQHEGTDYLVMEFLEGETLAHRLERGPLPLDQALRCAIEIVDALDKAHRQGVTHRDLKPGNIMLTKSGSKLLDFGLAKLRQEAAPAIALSQLPTMKSVTQEGTILGTLQYMAPEQVEGKVDEIDPRTDIFAFGAVVYEMATGKKAFEGNTPASVMAKILETDPPSMASVQPLTPPALDRVVKKCLAKEPEDRWQSAKDLTDELKWIVGASSETPKAVAPEAEPAAKGWWRAVALALAVLAIAGIAGFAVWNLKPSPPRSITHFAITLPPDERLAVPDLPAVAVSPDGTHVAYVAIRTGGIQQLYLRAMDSLESRSISGTEGAVDPFFSPDGQWLVFFADGKLKKVSVSGGAAVSLGDAAFSAGASWGSQGMIVFAPNTASILRQVSEAGGTPQPLTRFEKGELSHRWPEFLPGSKAVLFAASTSTTNWINARVAVQPIATGQRRDLVQGAMYPHYAFSGHLVYAQGGNLMAVPFDPRKLEVTGTAVPVLEGVLQSPSTGAAQYSFSATGSLVYVPGFVQSAQSRLVWVSRNGAEQLLVAPAHAYQQPRSSPDGRRIAVQIVEQGNQIWLYDFGRETLTRLTFEGNANAVPLWTPDGKRIAFYSVREGPRNIFWQMADGTGGPERLTTGEYLQTPNSWSPDGQLLAFHEVAPTTGRDIWVLRMGDRKAQPFLRTPFNEAAATFSPDGHWLAYTSDESGRPEIYALPYPGPGGKWQVSTEGGTEPVWNRNGRELFYRNGDKMMAVEITTQPTFSAGKPRVLFEGPYVRTRFPNTIPYYDVSPDGQRFLMVKEGEQVITQINVVLNWFEELKHRVPSGKE